MTKKAVNSTNRGAADFRNMSMEEKFWQMNELYRKAAEDGSLKRNLKARKRGVEEVARRWQRLKGLA